MLCYSDILKNFALNLFFQTPVTLQHFLPSKTHLTVLVIHIWIIEAITCSVRINGSFAKIFLNYLQFLSITAEIRLFSGTIVRCLIGIITSYSNILKLLLWWLIYEKENPSHDFAEFWIRCHSVSLLMKSPLVCWMVFGVIFDVWELFWAPFRIFFAIPPVQLTLSPTKL
jgi:hypothetical protein